MPLSHFSQHSRLRSRGMHAYLWLLEFGVLFGLAPRLCQAQAITQNNVPGGFWVGLSIGGALILLISIVFRVRSASAAKELEAARELAQHREHERNLAQQELVRRLEEERELAKEKLQFDSQLSEYEKYASLAQLALGAAHEINNPLLGILSHLELEWRTASTEQRTEIEQCIEAAKRISSTLQGLLNYARPNPLILSKVNLHLLTADTLKFLEHHPMFRQIQLENAVPKDLPSIRADGNQLSQVLMNLLLNGAQATPASGCIRITAAQVEGGLIDLRVSDTGRGIPPDILPHIFEPFFTTKRGHGTGLGLSISQSYIRTHGGEIHVESKPGEGTTVRVTLPIQQPGKRLEEEEVIA